MRFHSRHQKPVTRVVRKIEEMINAFGYLKFSDIPNIFV